MGDRLRLPRVAGPRLRIFAGSLFPRVDTRAGHLPSPRDCKIGRAGRLWQDGSQIRAVYQDLRLVVIWEQSADAGSVVNAADRLSKQVGDRNHFDLAAERFH